MARVTVTAFTAARMLAIEQSTVTGGRITGDNLILTTRDGSTIVAGSVKGPQGDRGEAGGIWDATSTLKGALKLAGNIGGSADVPKITGTLEATVDTSATKVVGTWTHPVTNVVAAVESTAREMLALLRRTDYLARNAIVAKGAAKVLWAGSEAEYLALPLAERNDIGFNGIIY